MNANPFLPVVAGFYNGYRFLSNFWPAVVEWRGDLYATVEHAYQAAKFEDDALRVRFRSRHLSPAAAKRLANCRELRVCIRPSWGAGKLDVMRYLLEQKFAPGSELAARLMETGRAELVEENTWGDTYWGRCRGEGQNHLGVILMTIRDNLHTRAAQRVPL